MESSFSDAEKRFVLAEMIKASHMDVSVLVNFINQNGLQPDWMEMQLPRGRNMNQCHRAVEAMLSMAVPPPTISPLKRKSFSDIGDHTSKKQVIGSPGEASQYSIPRNVNTQSPGLGQPVNIQPRPNGFPSSTVTPSAPINPISQNVILPPRRRGRPPKAETLARQSGSQQAHYHPISPAPAPSPVQAIAPRPQSPAGSYQVWSSTPPEAKSKKKGRQSADDRQLPLPETVPRTIQGAPSSELDNRQAAGPGAEYPDWRERTSGREPPKGGPMLAPLEHPLPPILPPPHSPHPPLEGGARAREPPTPTLEQTGPGGHPATLSRE